MPAILPNPKRYVIEAHLRVQKGAFYLWGDQEVINFVNSLPVVRSISTSADMSGRHTVNTDMRYCATMEDAAQTVNWIRAQLDAKFDGKPIPASLK